MSAAAESPLLDVKDLVQRYTLPRESLFRPPGQVLALNGVSARIEAGKSLGVVGESGSGKSTFARVVMALERPTSGQVALLGRGRSPRREQHVRDPVGDVPAELLCRRRFRERRVALRRRVERRDGPVVPAR